MTQNDVHYAGGCFNRPPADKRIAVPHAAQQRGENTTHSDSKRRDWKASRIRHAFVTHLITFLLRIIRSFEDSFMQEDNSPYERKCHAFAHEIKC